MKYIESVDKNGNNWKLKTVQNPTYAHKKLLYLCINDNEFKVMNFVTQRECGMFWDLLQSNLKGEILEEKEVTDATSAN